MNIGFNQNSSSYYLSEDSQIDTVVDHLKIDYDSFPLFINYEKDDPFFYIINDTAVPFTIDRHEKTIKLISNLDREKQDRYTFEIELQLKPSYLLKLQEIYNFQDKNSLYHFRFSNKFYHKLLITVYIKDVNDNAPLCNSFHKHIYLNESQIQKNIFHVKAIDPDLGKFYSIFFYINLI